MANIIVQIELSFPVDLFDVDEIPAEVIESMLLAVKEEREALVTEAKIYLLKELG